MKKTVDKIPFYRLGWNKNTYKQGGLYFNRPGHWLCCQIS
jgi:hypothetical protein